MENPSSDPATKPRIDDPPGDAFPADEDVSTPPPGTDQDDRPDDEVEKE